MLDTDLDPFEDIEEDDDNTATCLTCDGYGTVLCMPCHGMGCVECKWQGCYPCADCQPDPAEFYCDY